MMSSFSVTLGTRNTKKEKGLGLKLSQFGFAIHSKEHQCNELAKGQRNVTRGVLR